MAPGAGATAAARKEHGREIPEGPELGFDGAQANPPARECPTPRRQASIRRGVGGTGSLSKHVRVAVLCGEVSAVHRVRGAPRHRCDGRTPA